MKKNILYSNHALSKPVMVLLLLLAFMPGNIRALRTTPGQPPAYFLSDTSGFKSYTGKIIDKESKEPVVFASVQLENSKVGTVTNSDGEFIIKVPDNKFFTKLLITHLGYRTAELSLAELSDRKNIIQLEKASIPISEVTIRPDNPLELMYAAMNKRSSNYSTIPVMLNSFYRETIKKNRNYVAVSEAIIDIYKAPYLNAAENDRSKIYKGRKSQDVEKMDTILFKLQGGPYTALMLDVVKNPGEILSYDFFELYNYTFSGINYINDRLTYIIEFTQKDQVTEPLYEGRIYLDADNLAFTGIDFNLRMTDPDQVSQMFVRKKPVSLNVDVLSADYMTKYREINGIWYLSYVRSEVQFKCKWKGDLFSSIYTTMTEMAVTDIVTDNISKFKLKESAKFSDILAEQVTQFEDPDYWGNYNIIKPDESIEAAIDKLNRKLKRQF